MDIQELLDFARAGIMMSCLGNHRKRTLEIRKNSCRNSPR